MIYVVTYIYDPDVPEQMDEIRPAHREFLGSLHAQGTLIASGPWVDSNPGAYLLLKGQSAEDALTALDGDPFHRAGFILKRSIQTWNPVLGDLASHSE